MNDPVRQSEQLVGKQAEEDRAPEPAIMIMIAAAEALMPTIRPISDLRNKTQEISSICHESDEPVFITKNGEGDLVVMSLAAYERDQARLELYRQLEEAEADVRAGDKGISLASMRKRLGR